MRECARRLAVLTVALVAAHGAQAGETLDGYWMDSDGEVILNIGPCGKARCGKVAWLRKPRGADGALCATTRTRRRTCNRASSAA